MERLIAVSDWFLDRATFKNLRDRIRGRAFILLIGLALLSNALLGLLFPDPNTTFITLIGSQILCLLGLLLYTKLSGRYRLAAVLHFLIVQGNVCLLMFHAQSLLSIYYASIGTRVVVASFILGFRMALPLIVFYVATTVGMMQWNSAFGQKLPFAMTLESFATLLLIALLLAQVAMILFSWLYHESLQQDYARLKKDRTQLFGSARSLDLSRMLGELNHHINNPLSIVHAHLYRLSQRNWDAVTLAAECGSESPSQQALHKVRFIVEHLKMLASPDSLEQETRMSVRDVCLNLLTRFQEPFRLKGIDFRFMDQTMNLSFIWRRHELFTILAGLIQNACEAVESSAERSVTLAIERRDSWLVFTVSDSGAGIADADRTKLFKPFFSTKKGSDHLGLTLVTSRAQLEDRGGFLISETVRQGASFQLGLPFTG